MENENLIDESFEQSNNSSPLFYQDSDVNQ